MVVSESTHWDPNWLFTSHEYFRFRVRRTLDRVLDALVEEPRRVFSLECAFFPDLYWAHRPARRDLFRSLVNDGRLRFSGCGVTTPDTLLPEDELVLRDLLVGQEWIRSRGMTTEPRVMYLPDSFGHSPGTPSLLAAAGIPYAAVCRIDGMRFPGADMESPMRFPRPGSSAEHLLDERTADFVWRGPDRSEVLAHWMTYGYGHGDMLASGGLSRALGLPTSWPDRRERHVARRIEGYIGQLTRVARTPYMLLAIGFDFVQPVHRLVDLLDRWNENDYERSGVWLVNAGIEDYLDLVAHHREALPTLSLDPNPYWMGFYASRPDIKALCRDLGRQLIDADNERARATTTPTEPDREPDPTDPDRTSAAWWTAVASNHHDYITGTSPDRVARGEQTWWLRAALADSAPPRPPRPDAARRDGQLLPTAATRWTRSGSTVTVTTPSLIAVFDEQRGGTLVSLIDPSGTQLLSAPSLELRSYAESGGLWRMGHEFRGGRWAQSDSSSDHDATITVTDTSDGGIRVGIRVTLDGHPADLSVRFPAHDTGFLVHTSVTAHARRTVTLVAQQRRPITSLTMHQPGGTISRELTRWYEPTFWPLHSFASASSASDHGDAPAGLTIATATPTALHAAGCGTIETVVARTAVKELAFGIIPVLAPAWGRRWGTQVADLAMDWVPVTDIASAIGVGRHLQRVVDSAVGRSAPTWLIETDDPLVEVVAVKVADRGVGTIVRLRNWATPDVARSVEVGLAAGSGAVIVDAWRTDSRERDLDRQQVRDGIARVALDAYVTTVRVTSAASTSTASTSTASRSAIPSAVPSARG